MYQKNVRAFRFRVSSFMVMVLVMAVMLSACSTSSTPAESSRVNDEKINAQKPKEEKVELTLWATQAGVLRPGQKPGDWIAEDLVPEWNQLHPNVKINVEIIPFDGINEKITTAIASGTTPNLLLDYLGRTLAYGQMGALAPLDDVIPESDLKRIRQNQDVMKMVSVNGEIVAMPYSSGIGMLILNKSLWKEAGAEHLLPQDEYRTWTYDEFKEAMRAVADPDNGVYGMSVFALNEQGDQLYNNLMVAAGAKLFSEDYSQYIAHEFKESSQALEFVQSLVDEGLVHAHPETVSAVNAFDYWKQRKNGIVLGGTVHADIIKNGLLDGSVVAPHEYMFVNYPSPVKGKSALKMEVGFGSVFKSHKEQHDQWAKKFLYWMQTGSQSYATASKAFNPFGGAPKWTSEDPELEFLAKAATKASEWTIIDPGWGIKGYPEMRAAMFPEIQRMFISDITPEETVKSIAEKFNAIIKKYN